MKRFFIAFLVLSMVSCKKDAIQYTIEGTVIDHSTQLPVSGAKVTVSQKPFNNAVTTSTFIDVGTTQTNSAGFYSVTFDREKVTEFQVEIEKEGYFDVILNIGSAEVTSDHNNVFNASMDGMSWAKISIQNAFPNTTSDNLTLIFYSYRTGCEGCISADYNYFEGIIDTTVTYTNTAGNYLKFTFADGLSSTTDSLLMPMNDTVSYSITY